MAVEDQPQLSILCSADGGGYLPVVDGVVNGFRVSVLRDSGATTAGVRRSLVRDDQFTGETQRVISFGGKVESFPLAKVHVDTSFFAGDLICCVIDEPVVDLILGNLKGIQPLPNFVGMVGSFNQTQSSHGAVASVATRAQVKRDQEEKVKLPGVTSLPLSAVSPNELSVLQKKDASLQGWFCQAASGVVSTSGSNSYRFVVKDELLQRHFFRGDAPATVPTAVQLAVPSALRDTVLVAAHDALLAGHYGVKRTLERVRLRFSWPGVSADVRRYCRSCDVCQRSVPKGRVPNVPLQFMPRIETPFWRVAVDIVGPLSPPSEEKHRFILTIIDVATRYPEAVPLRSIDSVSVAEALFTVFSRVGFPQEVLSDRGTQFTSDMMKEFHRMLGVKRVLTSPYHAQSNGLVERFHGTLKQSLKKVVQKQPRAWHRYLPALLFAYRELPNESTGFSPFELLFGRRARGPMDLLANAWSGDRDAGEAKTIFQHLLDLKSIVRESCEIAHDKVDLARSVQKHYRDKNSRAR